MKFNNLYSLIEDITYSDTDLKEDVGIKTLHNEKIFSKETYAKEYYTQIKNSLSKINFTLDNIENISGKIYKITDNNVIVDIGYREYVYIDKNKEKRFLEGKDVGDDINIKISYNKKQSYIKGSIEELEKEELQNSFKNSIGTDISYTGFVKEILSSSGYNLIINGINCFMPGSHAHINKIQDFDSIIGKNIKVCIINYDYEKDSFIVSHKKYLETLIPEEVDKLKRNSEHTGIITGYTDYGVFVEFNGCLTSMIHKNSLDENTKKLFENKLLHSGDPINFKIKNIFKNKIIITQLDELDPWDEYENKYKDKVLELPILKVKDYGLFLELEKNVIGSVNFNRNHKKEDYNIGDIIKVKLSKIDFENRKIYFVFNK